MVRLGVTRWAGYVFVAGWLNHVAFLLKQGTGSKWLDRLLWLGVIGDTLKEKFDENKYELLQRFDNFVVVTTMDQMKDITGVRPDSLSKEGLIQWAGKVAAKSIPESYGIKVESVYPPNKLVSKVFDGMALEVINANQSTAAAITSKTDSVRIMRRATDKHNMIVGTSAVVMLQAEIDRLKKHKLAQQAYRRNRGQLGFSTNTKNDVINELVGDAMAEYYELLAAYKAEKAAQKAAAVGTP